MPFEKNLRRLAPRLPEKDVPSALQERTLSRLPETHSLQKVPFDMKLILLPSFLLVAVASGLLVTRILAPRLPISTLLHVPRPPTVAVRLHFVDEAGMPIPQARVTLWGYDSPETPGGAPPALVIGSPNRVEAHSDAHGDVIVTNGHLSYFSASADALALNAFGEITASEGEQVVTLSEHPMHTVTGRFVDAKGQPLMGVKPELYVVDSQTTQGLMTDPRGRFIAFVVPGNAYRITLNQPGYVAYSRDRIRVEKGQHLDLGTITLPAR